MALPVVREKKIYKQGLKLPWVVSQLEGPDEKYFISVRSPVAGGEVVILEQLEKDDYDNLIKVIESAVNLG